MAEPIGPAWFTDALAVPYEETEVVVDGCPIHYLSWGHPRNPPLVLVHGGAAHAQWWTYLAPMFSADWYVVAPDMSGHGDSGHRSSYSQETWADELVAVIDHAGCGGPPVIVGHSLGGLMTIVTAERHGDHLAGAIIADSGVRRPDPESEASRTGRFHGGRVYADRREALSRFKLIPPQPCDNDFILHHIAAHSIREVEGGWTWKFDPGVFGRHLEKPMSEYLSGVRCRVALVRGELSQVNPPDTAAYMYELLHRRAPVVSIPQARHHLMIDQPLAFVAAVRALLGDWDHSVPLPR
ncbi:MAG TPA: alpha/beta hydrolase [Acidimicrobiales bacterium]|nr:alpha/beta hydrolase [Acidimicrobiales bacterium]